MTFSTIRFMSYGWVNDFYVAPEFHFSYYGFDWLPYPSEMAIYAMFYGMLACAILITLGLFYRFASIGFFILFTYIELLDKTTYLNHYYFVSLVALLLIFLPANRYFSLDVRLGLVRESETVKAWHTGILKFQMAIVYIFAGIAKLESDWLFEAQPLKYWLHTAHHWPIVGDLFTQDWVAYLFSWAGCIYDLFIVFFLLNAKTRNFAYGFVILFHFLTWMLFPIGVFPWVMMVGTLIFLSDNLHKRALDVLRNILAFIPFPNFKSERKNINPQSGFRIANVLLASYISFQILFPFRYLLYPGDLFWTEEGFRFSWRVMLMEKAGHGYFYLHDPETGIEWEVPTCNHLTYMQEKQMRHQPDMILQYASYLEETYQDTTISTGHVDLKFKNPEIRAEVFVTLNGRPSQLFIDKKHNLAALENNLSHRYWLEPYNK